LLCSFENLRLIRDAGVTCPLLCKEFIVEAYQVFKARARWVAEGQSADSRRFCSLLASTYVLSGQSCLT
jgi:hypothetical protein